ncbi:MAG: hypothetical protein HYW80_00305 [Parcubacteria group bacterium]|nr:hypothetical protein [Parcubacteria group bacterium]
MDMESRNQYLKALIEERGYLMKPKKEKGLLLDEFCKTTNQNRKWAIAKIRNGSYLKSKEEKIRKAKKKIYDNEFVAELVNLWKLFEYPCGQRMESTLKTEVDRLIRSRELTCSEEVAEKLKQVSARTIDIKLEGVKTREYLKGKYQRKVHPLLYQEIPVKVWAEQDRNFPGNIQADLVEHCGQSALGPFINTISTTDIYSGWWQGIGVMGKDKEAVHHGLSHLRDYEYPFGWQGLHSDNDTAFINNLLYSYCQKDKILFSRSRPYKKNDNCLVEGKNKTHVRQIVGYRRYDTIEELETLNEIYEKSALFKNFFGVSMKLVKKERIKGHIKRVYDKPKTPYQRVMDSEYVLEETKRELRDTYNSLRPTKLKQDIEKLQTALYETYEKKQGKSKGRSVRFLIADQDAVSVR